MTKQTKLGIALGTLYVAGAVGATVAVNMTKHKVETKTKIELPPIKTELPEEEASKLFDELIKLGASYGRANLLINEVNTGHITKEQLEQIIKEWNA